MAKQAVTMRLEATVIDDLNYLNYLMRAKSTAQVVSEVVTLAAGAIKAVVSDDPELLANGGTVLSREEQDAWATVRRWLQERATGTV
ncbi:MAG: hypothetical protein C7B45_03560 [Sulfobacillus acidophilus]|jgi:hypothetical protein|uniref:Uncharacterized protein n=1 Tax=Sulfobacillus acidophilus TaxID=53633 RepID=A0A2T2WMD1_9FIRM|nr:MAG: hypothetical protein C7B45_03560 [Sulfobacillus acidophilus]